MSRNRNYYVEQKVIRATKKPSLLYLLLIGLIAAIAGGAFRMDDHVLLIPAGLLTIVLLVAIGAGRGFKLRKHHK